MSDLNYLRKEPLMLILPLNNLSKGNCMRGTAQSHCGSRSPSGRELERPKVQSTRSHLQLNRNSLAFKSTGVGNIPNHDVELARSTNVVVAAGTKPRNFWRKKQARKKQDKNPKRELRNTLEKVRLKQTYSTAWPWCRTSVPTYPPDKDIRYAQCSSYVRIYIKHQMHEDIMCELKIIIISACPKQRAPLPKLSKA